MNNFEAINFIKQQAKIMVEFLKANNCIDQHGNFKLEVRPSTNEGWKGGLTKEAKPIIHYSLFHRYTDIDSWVNHLATMKGHYSGKVWHTAQQYALKGKYMFVEYSNISNKQHIGSYIAKSTEHCLLGVIAHEVAHAVQHWNFYHTLGGRPSGYEGKPHGLYWQRLYTLLRQKFVNNFVVEQTTTPEPVRLAANKTVKPMRLTTAFRKAGFVASKVTWDKQVKANKICAMFDGQKSMIAYQFQGEGRYEIFDLKTDPECSDPILRVTSKEGQKLIDFLTN